MKRSTRGFVSGFSVAILATGAWGVFGSGGGGSMLATSGEFSVGMRDGVQEEIFIPLKSSGVERIEAGVEMEKGRQCFAEGRDAEGLEKMAGVVEMVPGDVGFRIEYAGRLQERGKQLYLGGHRDEGAVLLERASYHAQTALGMCEGVAERGREAADCYLLLGDLSFDAGRDAWSAAELYQSAVRSDQQNALARERLADALMVLDHRGERRYGRTF